MRYKYDGKMYSSVSSVLKSAPKIHPELSNVIESIHHSVSKDSATKDESSSCKKPSGGKEAGQHDPPPAVDTKVTLELKNLTLRLLTEFLHSYAPLQLLVDRLRVRKIFLPRKLLNAFSYMHIARTLVASAQPRGSNVTNDELLMKYISVNAKAGLPHPSWSKKHDAVLVRAIAKHGWIDRSYQNIVHDESLKWGVPFDEGTVSDLIKCKELKTASNEDHNNSNTNNTEEETKLLDVAKRALLFIDTHMELIRSVKGFSNERVMKTYGIVWKDSALAIDEDILFLRKTKAKEYLSDKASEAFKVDLPSKSDLFKRAKAVLQNSSNTFCSQLTSFDKPTCENKQVGDASDPDKNKISLLNQSDRCNVLFAEMLYGLLKISLNKADGLFSWRKLLLLARKEAENLRNAVKGEALSEMDNIIKHLLLVERSYCRSSTTPLKNVLRAIMGLTPHQSGNPQDSLFPVDPPKVSSPHVDSSEPNSKTQKSPCTSLNTGHQKVNAKPKKAIQRQNASGDVALNRALSQAAQKGASASQPIDTTDLSGLLPLNFVEVLLLTVMLSKGVPWSEVGERFDAGSSGNGEENKDEFPSVAGKEYLISWKGLAAVFESASAGWYQVAVSKLSNTPSETENLPKNSITSNKGRELELEIRKQALKEANELSKSALNYARRNIMLLEALRSRMGSVDTVQGGSVKKIRLSYKSDFHLGPRVMNWCGKEISKWAVVLQVFDKTARHPYSKTAFELCPSPQHFHAAVYLDKKACRTIYCQIAQQSRLRSLFIKYGRSEIKNQLPKALKNSVNNGDEWPDRPLWWNDSVGCSTISECKDDFDLLSGLLDLGYSNFDNFLKSHDSFQKRMKVKVTTDEPSITGQVSSRNALSSASVQQRVNSLTRELNAIDDTAEMIKKINERSRSNMVTSGANPSENNIDAKKQGGGRSVASAGSIQTGIDAFFRSKKTFSSVNRAPKTNTPSVLEKLPGECDLTDKCTNDIKGKRNACEPSIIPIDTAMSPEKKPKLTVE